VNLLLGAGNSREKRIAIDGHADWFGGLTTVDWNPTTNPDVVHDLRYLPWPFDDNQFLEVHAYEVLEHLHQQGDYLVFFAIWEEIHRITKPGGIVCGTTPSWDTLWAWADPGHTAVYSEGTLVFLSQSEYEDQVGRTPMSDYRSVYNGDFKVLGAENSDGTFRFILEAVK